MLFVGEKRSELAKKMGVRWEDGRLAAKQLFDALEACGVDPKDCLFANWFQSNKRAFIRSYDGPVFAMGKIVQAALEREGIDHIPIVHPAARGEIRKKERYRNHIRKALKVAAEQRT